MRHGIQRASSEISVPSRVRYEDVIQGSGEIEKGLGSEVEPVGTPGIQIQGDAVSEPRLIGIAMSLVDFAPAPRQESTFSRYRVKQG